MTSHRSTTAMWLDPHLGAAGVEPARRLAVTYEPVFELASGRMVGVEAAAAAADRDGSVPPASGSEVLRLIAGVATDLRARPAAVGDWWIALRFDWACVGGPQPASSVAAAWAINRLRTERLVLELPEAVAASTAGPSRSGAGSASLSRLLATGVRVAAPAGTSPYLDPDGLLQLAPLAFVRVDLAGLARHEARDVSFVRAVVAAAAAVGTPVLGEGIETDDHLELAHLCGIELVQGYRWGSPGSIDKLIQTWGRVP